MTPSLTSILTSPVAVPNSAATELPVPLTAMSPLSSPSVFCMASVAGNSCLSRRRRARKSMRPSMSSRAPSSLMVPPMVPPAMPKRNGSSVSLPS
ncbi:hypothetical protein D3C72_1141670 [compost metagenome]